MYPPTFLARRFVAGERVEDAVNVGRKLNDRGIRARDRFSHAPGQREA